MAGLVIVAGPCGKGSAFYAGEALSLPDGSTRWIETLSSIDDHGSIVGGGRDHWASDVLRSVKGGLALAGTLELTGLAGTAANAIGAGLSTLDEPSEPTQRALVEMTFLDGTVVVALAHPALPGLMLHDRAVVQRTIARLRERAVTLPEAPAPGGPALFVEAYATASGLTEAVTDRAGTVFSSAFSLLRREKT